MTVITAAEKLHITDADRLFVVGADQDALETLQPLPDDLELSDDASQAEVVLAFGRSVEELELRLGDIERAGSRAHTWILYAKDDLGASARSRFDDVAARGGWRITASQSIDATWEALRIERVPEG